MHWTAVLLVSYAAAVLELKRLCDGAPLCDGTSPWFQMMPPTRGEARKRDSEEAAPCLAARKHTPPLRRVIAHDPAETRGDTLLFCD